MWKRDDADAAAASRQSPPPPAPYARDAADKLVMNLGKSVMIKGELSGSEDLTLYGRMEGSVKLPEYTLTIGPDADIKAEISAKTVVIMGGVTGNVIAGEKVEIRSTGSVTGDIASPRFAIQDGGSMWIPLAFLALHRTIERPRIRHGLATGAAIALQMLSSIYYGIFLATLLPVCAVLLQLGHSRAHFRRVMVALAAGAILAGALIGPYARPYLLARDRVGERPDDQIRTYAARPADYLVVPRENWLYGRWETRGEGERRLFPGAVTCLLAVAALFLRRPSRLLIVYVFAAVAAFEASLGFRGYSYTFLHEHVSVFRGLRAPARLGIFVVFFLAVLAGFAYTFFAAALRVRSRVILLLALLSAVLLEDFTTLLLVPYPNTAPPVYRLLASQPRGVVAEFPMVPQEGNAARCRSEDRRLAFARRSSPRVSACGDSRDRRPVARYDRHSPPDRSRHRRPPAGGPGRLGSPPYLPRGDSRRCRADRSCCQCARRSQSQRRR